MARTAEDVGLDSLWLGDHLLYDLPGGVTRGSLGGLDVARRPGRRDQTRVELGPFVASTTFHAPAMLAEAWRRRSTRISGGRLVLGLGAGWNEREYTGLRVPLRPAGSPGSRRPSPSSGSSSATGGPTSVGGSIPSTTASSTLRQPRPGGPPLMLGSTSPRMMRIGLPHVDLWNAWWSDYGNSVDGLRVGCAPRSSGPPQAAGRGPGRGRCDGGGPRPARRRESGRTMGDGDYNAPVAPVPVRPAAIAEHLLAMAEAGAVHVQLVLDPITVRSIEVAGKALELLSS